jgi:two-component system, chemotaxis family, chemotaxis protein CheY
MSRIVSPSVISKPAANLNFSQARTLVVDDNALARDILDYALGELNVGKLHMAENGLDGLVKLQTIAPDLVLVDWVMEPMDGISFVREVRSLPGSMRFVPIIMVTGYSEEWRVNIARDVGVHEFIVKPFTAKTLFAKMRATIENPRPFVEIPNGYFGPDRRRRRIPVSEERRQAG